MAIPPSCGGERNFAWRITKAGLGEDGKRHRDPKAFQDSMGKR
jgi:hypothetical protein